MNPPGNRWSNNFMFTFRNTTIVFFLLILISTGLGLFAEWNGSLVTGCCLLAVWLVVVVLGAMFIRWNFYFFSYCLGNRNEPFIALTFDDGPDEKVTPEILGILQKNNIRAAFFCIGNKAEKHPELIRQIFEKGHIIGNHSYSHAFWFDLFSSGGMAREIRKTDEILYNIVGKKPLLFRPPYGVTNPTLGKALKSTGHLSVGWSLRTKDTVRSPEQILKYLKKKLKNGDVVLFHDSLATTPELIEKVIPILKQSGRQFAALDELLKIEAYDQTS